jgi:hypothetical protein
MPVSLRDNDDDYDDGDWAALDVVILIWVFYSVSLKTVQVTDTFDGYDMDKVMPTMRDNGVGGGGEEGEGGRRRRCGPPIAGR